MKQQLQDLFRQHLEDLNIFKNSKGIYEDEVFIDYRYSHDIESFIQSMTKDHNPQSKDELLDILQTEIIMPYEIDTLNSCVKSFFDNYQNQIEAIDSDITRTDFTEQLDTISFYQVVFNLDEFINQMSLNINIVLETPETFDREFSNNNFADILDFNDDMSISDVSDLYDILSNSSLNTLLVKQGYTIDQFIMFYLTAICDEPHALDNDETACSIYNEIINAYRYNALTVTRQMTLKNYIDLFDQNDITIKTNETIGYHCFVDGSGSIFNIKLKQPMTYHKDEYQFHIDGNFGYGIEETYGSFN